MNRWASLNSYCHHKKRKWKPLTDQSAHLELTNFIQFTMLLPVDSNRAGQRFCFEQFLLTHWGPEMTYGFIKLAQHWLLSMGLLGTLVMKFEPKHNDIYSRICLLNATHFVSVSMSWGIQSFHIKLIISLCYYTFQQLRDHDGWQ